MERVDKESYPSATVKSQKQKERGILEDQKTDGSHLVISFRMINSLTVLADILKASFPCNFMRKERVTILVENEGLTACKCMCPIMRNTTARAQLIAQSGICTS